MTAGNHTTLRQEPGKVQRFLLIDNGIFPNSGLPAILVKSAFTLKNDHLPAEIESVFEENGWSNCWRNGMYHYHHYHSNTHEVLGVYSGECHVLLGGDSGVQFLIEKGDVLIIPAGVAHKNIGSSLDFKCVGAYPGGKEFDIKLGKASERPEADHHIRKVPLPKKDPLYGKDGILALYWKEEE